jgi:hypothetical protein
MYITCTVIQAARWFKLKYENILFSCRNFGIPSRNSSMVWNSVTNCTTVAYIKASLRFGKEL